MRHASTRAELGRAQEEKEEEITAIGRRYDAAVARSEGLQRELGEQQAAASREAEAAAAALRDAMETSVGQDAGAKQAAQAAQTAQAAAERSVQGLQGQVNDLDQRLQQALAQVCSSRTCKALPAMSTSAPNRASARPSGAYAGGRAGTRGARFGARAERECWHSAPDGDSEC